MTYVYWQQWDKGDLDSWQGRDVVEEDEEEEGAVVEGGCSCGYYCMECLGMSWRDFM